MRTSYQGMARIVRRHSPNVEVKFIGVSIGTQDIETGLGWTVGEPESSRSVSIRWSGGCASVSRLRPLDLMRVGTLGLRVRVSRTCLTALGITVGISAIVAVLGITASTDAQLEAELNALGPNLLQVEPGDSITGEEVVFDAAVAGMLERIGPVDDAAATSPVDASVRRTEFIPSGQTGGISVLVADADLLEVLDTAVARGVWLDERTSGVPATVLGSVAARRLGVRDVAGSPLVYMSGTYFEVVGILEPVSPSPSIDRSALIGREIAGALFDFTAEPEPCLCAHRGMGAGRSDSSGSGTGGHSVDRTAAEFQRSGSEPAQ